jgi:hypothetical protein
MCSFRVVHFLFTNNCVMLYDGMCVSASVHMLRSGVWHVDCTVVQTESTVQVPCTTRYGR